MPDLERRLTLTYSQISAWLRCRYYWGIAWKEGLEPDVPPRGINIGSAVHTGLEAFQREWLDSKHQEKAETAAMVAIDRYYERFLPMMDEENGEGPKPIAELHDLYRIVLDAVAFLEPDRWSTVHLPGVGPLIEQTLHSDIDVFPTDGQPFGVRFQGTMDWVARDLKDGGVWVIDYKARQAFMDDEAEETNLQNALYQGILLKNGLETVGARVLQIKSKVPQQPRRNKDGSMSRQDVSTTWPVYRDALVAAGLDPADYTDMRFKLEGKQGFQGWQVSFRGTEEIESVWNDVMVETALEIAFAEANPDHIALIRNIGYFSCLGCMGRPLCFARLRGHDAEWIAATQYRKRIQSHEQEHAAEEVE